MILDEFRKIFHSFLDFRQNIDNAIEIANNVLKVVEGERDTLNDPYKESRLRLEIIQNYYKDERVTLLNEIPTVAYLEKQKQAYGDHQRGTGTWFLADPRFQNWKNSDQPSILLCKGIPGAEKAVLTALAVDDVSNDTDHDTQVA